MNTSSHKSREKIKAVFFDLDGTMMATACDLTVALNQLLAKYQRPEVSQASVEKQASNGIRGMLQTGFSIPPSHPEFRRLSNEYLSIYQSVLQTNCTTPLYPGIQNLIDTLEKISITWGIVTNKPRTLTLPLMQKHELSNRCPILLCPEDVSQVKPSPEPLLKAARMGHLKPVQCVYIGDHERDILAGKRAGMQTIAAAYGYVEENVSPLDWQATWTVNHPDEIMTQIHEHLN